MGLDVYLKHNGITEEAESTSSPGHLFKRGYFRSSYNGSGYDAVMRRSNCPTLDQIFGVPNESGGDFIPDWGTALLRAESALEQYREHLASPAGGHHVDFIDADRIIAKSEGEALAIYAKHASAEKVFRAFGTRDGSFWLDGAKVKAAIPGTRFGTLGLFLVFENQPEEGETGDWYEQALLIVIETIEYVLASGKTDEFALYWSA